MGQTRARRTKVPFPSRGRGTRLRGVNIAPAASPPGASTLWLLDVLRQLPSPPPVLPELPAQLEQAWGTACSVSGLNPWELAARVACQFGLRSESLPPELPDESVAWSAGPVPLELGAVLLRREEGYAVIAVSDPSPPDLLQRLRFASESPVELVVAPPADLRQLRHGPITSLHAEAREAAEADEEDDAAGEGLGEFDVEDASSTSAVVRLCNLMLLQAMRTKASDIHVQPVDGGGLVRMRIDGLLHKSARLPQHVLARLVARVKAVAGLDPTDRLRPQDGRASAVSHQQRMDLRISTIPVVGGEKLVIRLLGGHAILRLDDLDLPELERRQIANLTGASMGVVVAAGPTGSGKTTTLHAMLADLNRADINIVTVEDPVEMRVPLLAQTEVHPRMGVTFAAALRSVLRQDPDVILIGEIRDEETAGIAVQAAITGHLVFASVHANDAISVLPRLAELGVDGAAAAEAVRGVLSQRLVRALCKRCARPAEPPWTPAEAWLRERAGLEEWKRAVGCPDCAQTGYRGRRGILQVLTVTPEIAALLDHGAPLSEVRTLARQQGMRFLSESALDRVRRGQTSIDEVLRIMGTDFWREAQLVLGEAPPPGLVQASAHREDQGDRGAVLLFAADPQWRARLAAWLEVTEWRVVEAGTEQDVRDAMEHPGDFALAVVDGEDLPEERVRVLMAMRGVLAGYVVPLLFFAVGEDEVLASHIRGQAHTRVTERPESAADLRQQVTRALLA